MKINIEVGPEEIAFKKLDAGEIVISAKGVEVIVILPEAEEFITFES